MSAAPGTAATPWKDAATGVARGLQNRSAGERPAGGFDSHILPSSGGVAADAPGARAALPPVHAVLRHPSFREACGSMADAFRTRLVREVVDRHRLALRRADPTPDRARVAAAVVEDCVREARALMRPFPRRVVNATGILLHTNLGRAPLGELADEISLDRVDPAGSADGSVRDAPWEDVQEVRARMAGYCDLEWDAETQGRGDRDAHLQRQLRLLTGAAGALVVNNCASALLLALSALAARREVLVSRAELVEIGGGFRIPEMIEAGGCRLREVGTTNRTRLDDYARHARPGESVLLKVHPSNFVQRGFVRGVGAAELAALGRRLGVPVVEDCGSGLMEEDPALRGELAVAASLRAGVDVVCCSGDKLFGGVQAGILAGRAEPLAAMRRSPLYRVLRLDKVRMALLDAVLRRHLAGGGHALPLWRQFHAGPDELRARAAVIRLPAQPSRWERCAWVPTRAALGGGSNPDATFPSLGLELAHRELSAQGLRRRFAARAVPVAGRVRRGRFYLDLRTVLPVDLPEIQSALDELA